MATKKRPLGQGRDSQSSRAKKRHATRDARSIAVQRGPAAEVLGQGSKTATIDVEAFVEARKFEMKAMRDSMESAKASSSKRAFQTLPRSLRRRAASHNPARVPSRLQQKAMNEITAKKEGQKKTLRYKKRGLCRSEEFARRQKEKTWLETHLWHAKRMKMCTRWGYVIADTPTAKSFRPSYRASINSCLLHDLSYHCCLELRGTLISLISFLRQLVGPDVNLADPRYVSGCYACPAMLAPLSDWPCSTIGPCEILWKPIETAAHREEAPEDLQAKEIARSVWLVVHPSLLEDLRLLFESLLPASNVTMRLLARELNIFDLTGPRSLEILARVLNPTRDPDHSSGVDLWYRTIRGKTGEDSEKNLLIGLQVLDPRLNFPPPKRARLVCEEGLLKPVSKFNHAASGIWSESIRHRLRMPTFKQKEIDHRRSQVLQAGNALPPVKSDDKIPILLQRQSMGDLTKTGISGWRVFIPSGWAMPFWLSFVYCEAKVAGQREMKNQHFFAGLPFFPVDFPTLRANDEVCTKSCDSAKSFHERKPPAKRPSFRKLGTDDPFIYAWEKCLENGLSVSDRVTNTLSRVVATPWLLEGPQFVKALLAQDSLSDPTARLRQVLHDVLGTPRTLDFDGALVKVRIDVLARGSPEDMALIYYLSDEQKKLWDLALAARSSRHQKSLDPQLAMDFASLSDLEKAGPPRCTFVVGRVTTGMCSLSLGKGQAFGAIALSAVIAILQRDRLESDVHWKGRGLVLLKNVDNSMLYAGRMTIIA